MTLSEIADRYPGGRWHGDTYETHCPCSGHEHGDRNPSLGFSVGRHGGIVVCCQKGHPVQAVLAARGLSLRDIAPPSPNGSSAPYGGPGMFAPEAVYRYLDEQGEPLYEKVRLPRGAAQRFFLRLPGSTKGGIGETRRVLYGLPALLATRPGDTVAIVEGEKDADNVRLAGVAATTNPEGAALPGQRPKWRAEYTEWLKQHLPERRFAVFADQDEAGLAHAEAVIASLKAAGLSVFAVPLAGLAAKEDISDWLGRHSAEEFQALLVPPAHPLDLRVLDGRQLEAAELPQPEALVPHLLYRGFSTLLAGDSKLGKSSLLLRALLAAACGGWWLDPDRLAENRLPESRILFLNFEDPLFLTRQRAQAMMRPDPLPRSFLTMDPPYGYRLDQVLDWLSDAYQRLRLDAVVLDPIAIAAEWEDETDNSEVARTFKALQRLAAETQLAILSAHHVTKKPGERGLNIRGGSAIKANVLGYLVLEPEKDLFHLEGINKLVGRWDVTLDRREHDFSWWIVESRAGSTATPQQRAKERAKADLFGLIRDEPGATTERLVLLSDLPERTCRHYLAEMEEVGTVLAADLPRGESQRGRVLRAWFVAP